MANEIQIEINGQRHFIPSPLSLSLLLKHFKIDPPYIAVAVNGEIVHRSEREAYRIKNGDRLEVIRAVAGG